MPLRSHSARHLASISGRSDGFLVMGLRKVATFLHSPAYGWWMQKSWGWCLGGTLAPGGALYSIGSLGAVLGSGNERRIYLLEHDLARDDALTDILTRGQVVHDVQE